jgi:3-oxoadipate enol-lactonase
MDTRFDEEWLASHPADLRLVEMMEDRALAPDLSRQSGVRLQLDARRRHDTWDRLSAIDRPTFVGAGRFDGIAPVGNSEAIVSQIATGALHVYDGGHAFLAQDPRAIVDVIEFLMAPPPPHAV